MNGVTQVVGLWPGRDQDVQAENAPYELEDFAIDDVQAEDAPDRDWLMVLVTAGCALAAAGWLAWLAMIYGPQWIASAPAPDAPRHEGALRLWLHR